MKSVFKWLKLLSCLIFFPTLANAKNIELSKDGNAVMPIVIPDEPSRVEKYSAAELKEHLDKISGGDFKILKLSEAKDVGKAIYVGDSPKARELSQIDPAKLEFDEIAIKTRDGNLVLIGHKKRGTLFAVESFLEDYLGVRWWTPSESKIPSNPTIAIEETDYRYAPVLKHRRLDYINWGAPRFTARLRA